MELLISSDGSNVPRSDPSSVFDVTTYGAVGDGITDDSEAFQRTWEAVCGAQSSSPTLRVPSEHTFLLKPITFMGDCTAQEINFEVLGNIVAPDSISAFGGKLDIWLSFRYIEGLNIHGTGQIDGRGSVWWSSQQNRPTAINFSSCNGLQLSGLTLLNSPRNHIAIYNCNVTTISNLNITAPEDSPNTDGINIGLSNQVLIQDSHIGTGDDCVSVLDGTSFVNITRVSCGPGHGISVGSLAGPGVKVEEIHVEHCSFFRTMNGARIKIKPGGSGYAKKITFNHITLSSVRNPIIIDQHYPQAKGTTESSTIDVREVTFTGFEGTTVSEYAINFKCSEGFGCSDIVLDKVNISSADPGKKTSSSCSNARVKSRHCDPPVHCLP